MLPCNFRHVGYCISGQWPVISDRSDDRHAESRKSETYTHGGAGNSGMWVLLEKHGLNGSYQ